MTEFMLQMKNDETHHFSFFCSKNYSIIKKINDKF